MSDFFTPAKAVRARTKKPCTYCAEPINPGDTYQRQSGHADCGWFTSHMHPECFAELCASEDDEFTPHSNERPPCHAPTDNPASSPQTSCHQHSPDTGCPNSTQT